MAVFLQVITLFLLIFCGFFSAKGKLVDENGISTLNKLRPPCPDALRLAEGRQS